jgi:hypothetical protein
MNEKDKDDYCTKLVLALLLILITCVSGYYMYQQDKWEGIYYGEVKE